MESGDLFLVLVDIGCPPVANPLQQVGEATVDGGVRAEQEADPVAAWLELDAFAGAALRGRDGFREPLRARGAELDYQ